MQHLLIRVVFGNCFEFFSFISEIPNEIPNSHTISDLKNWQSNNEERKKDFKVLTKAEKVLFTN